MEIITLDNIADRVLLVTQEDVDEANAYLESIAARYGVVQIQQPISHTPVMCVLWPVLAQMQA